MLILYVVDEDAVDTDEDKGIVTDGGVNIHNIERDIWQSYRYG